jgi:hypothetical protein
MIAKWVGGPLDGVEMSWPDDAARVIPRIAGIAAEQDSNVPADNIAAYAGRADGEAFIYRFKALVPTAKWNSADPSMKAMIDGWLAELDEESD